MTQTVVFGILTAIGSERFRNGPSFIGFILSSWAVCKVKERAFNKLDCIYEAMNAFPMNTY